MGGHVHSSPAVVDGRVYIGSRRDYKVYCLDENTGGVIWSYQVGDYVYSSPTVVDGKVYIGSLDTKVYCLDAEGGEILWSYKTEGEVYSSPAVVNGKVYVSSHDGNVYCLDAWSGNLVWSYQAGDIVHSSPAVADNKVFVGSYDGNLYSFGEPDRIVSVTPTSGRVEQGGAIDATVTVQIIGSINVELDTMGPPGRRRWISILHLGRDRSARP